MEAHFPADGSAVAASFRCSNKHQNQSTCLEDRLSYSLSESATKKSILVDESATKKSKMVKSFGAQYASARVEGVVVGRGTNKKVRVSWTNLKDPEDIGYDFDHTIFKDLSDERQT
jgi:hypothetical protein